MTPSVKAQQFPIYEAGSGWRVKLMLLDQGHELGAGVAAPVRSSPLVAEVMIFDPGFFTLRRVMHMCPACSTAATLSRSRASTILSYEPNRY